jgi:NAD(P)H-flavin reductase
MVPEPVPIAQVTRETRDTFTLGFDLSARPGGLPFAPGQFNMLYVFGVGEVPISISGDPGRPWKLFHTVRAVGSVTRAMRALKRGAQLGLRGPFGRGWPMEEARGKDVLVIAGGLGLAPLRPVIYDLLRCRNEFRRVAILYGARTPEDLLYRRQLERWRGRFDVRVLVTVDRAGPEWRGRTGVVTALFDAMELEAPATVAMICGPEVMMRFTVRELTARGLAEDRMYISLERNMKCAIGLCGHCQFGPMFVCKDGPVHRFDRVAWLFSRREI